MSTFLSTQGQPKKTGLDEAIIELAYSGSALANYLTFQNGSQYECVCGAVTFVPKESSAHTPHCPVARYYAAVERVRKAVL